MVEGYALIKGEEIVIANASMGLHGTASACYIGTLDEFKRSCFRTMRQGLDELIKALTGRFKNTGSVGMKQLMGTKYSMIDASNQRDPACYVQEIIQHAKDCRIMDPRKQLTFTYTKMDPRLQKFVTKLEDFIQELNEKKDTWFELHVGYNSNQGAFGIDNQQYQQSLTPYQGNANQGGNYYNASNGYPSGNGQNYKHSHGGYN